MRIVARCAVFASLAKYRRVRPVAPQQVAAVDRLEDRLRPLDKAAMDRMAPP